ncbi:MAG: CvpA family protein [Acidiferrobacterales bacterium]
MNVFDVSILLVLAIFGAIGAFRGLVRTVFFLVSWLVASAVAWFLAAPVAASLEGTIDEPIARMLAAFVLIFLVALFLGMAATSLLHKIMESMPLLKMSNRLLGGLAGVGVGVVVVVVGFLLAGLTALPQDSWWRHSSLAPFFESLAGLAADLLPTDIARHIRYG